MANSGSSGAIPGGGGGGGAATGYAGGNGASGQVVLTLTASSTPPDNVLRFLLDVPSGGGVNGAIYGELLTNGTIAKVDVVYGTGGTLQIVGKNASNVQLFASTAAGAYNGVPVIVSVELTPNGTGVNWALKTIPPGISSSVTTVASGTQASASIGSALTVDANVSGTETGAVVVGHYIVQGVITSLTDLAAAVSGYNGERAGTRFLRLCAEENVGAVLTGNASDTPQMGPQPDDTLVNVLQQTEDLDRGQLYETMNQFGLGYRTRVNMQNQTSVASIDYSLAQLSPGFAPTYDEQLTRNSVTLTRTGANGTMGSSVVKELDTGAKSTQSPPNGVGFYAYELNVNAFADSQLANAAGWILTVGTVDDFRYPIVPVDLTRVATENLFAAVPGMNIGDFFQIPNPPTFLAAPTPATIAEDASTPAVVTGSNVTELTTASFTPPNESLIVVLAAWGSNSSSGGSLTCTDSVGGTYTVGPVHRFGFGFAQIFYRYITLSPGAMTVEVNGGATFVQASPSLAVRVLTGAASDQSAAATLTASTSTTAVDASITTTTPGSWVYVVADGFPTVFPTSESPNTGTTQIESFYPAETEVLCLTGRQSAATVTPGSTSLGWTIGNAGSFALVAQEILPGVATAPVQQLAYGFAEQLSNFLWNISINAVPESPYTGAGLPTW